jgi:siroheme synthase
VSRLSLPGHDLRRGTLGTIARVAAGVRPPALVVIGAVAALDARVEAVWSATGD